MLKRTRPPAAVAAGALGLVAAAAGAVAASAQVTTAQVTTTPPGPYERARLLVESGRGAAGRQLLDSLVARSAPGSPALAEALWWRAAFAGDAVAAERDLLRVTGEVPASPRAGAATVRLAQLALLRDRPDEAAALLDPLVRAPALGRPADPARPQAAYWLARARLERRDLPGACSALDTAAAVPAAEPGLARQVALLRRRVAGCAESSRTTVAVASLATPPASSAQATTLRPAATQPPATPAPVPMPLGPVPGPPATPTPDPTTRTPTPSSPPLPSAPLSAPPSGSSPPGLTSPSLAPTPSRASSSRPTAPAFAVQIAAYDTRPGAESLVARLRTSGLDARAEGQGPAGDAAPFRIKVGRYPTRAAAAAALRDLRARGLTGFVTTAGAERAP